MLSVGMLARTLQRSLTKDLVLERLLGIPTLSAAAIYASMG